MFEWMEFALCRGVDPEIFFPAAEPGVPLYDAQVARARGICADCPVRSACLDWAIASGQDYGVWGGLDPAERRALVHPRLRATA
jgi:WhiB family transcriptional regulator, redox-sensing transcriptional regulator